MAFEVQAAFGQNDLKSPDGTFFAHSINSEYQILSSKKNRIWRLMPEASK